MKTHPDCGGSKMPTTMDLYYHFVSPYCRSVMLMARKVKVDLNLKEVNFMEGETRKPEFLKINPEHTVPVLVDGDHVLWERSVIGREVHFVRPS